MKKQLFVILMLLSFITIAQQTPNKYNSNNRKEGLWTETSLDSTLKIVANYENGIKNGVYKTYRMDGTLYGEGFMKNNELHGKFISYSKDGDKTSILEWDMGELVGQQLLNSKAKETGTIEIIGNKKYVWLFGELVETKELR